MWIGLPIAAFVALLIVVQAPAALSLVWRLWRRPQPAAGPWPKAAVILCVRGADETLERCLEGLRTLDYPQFEVVVVIDSETDPGAAVVKRVLDRPIAASVRIEPLTRPLETCSLKCSALIQAISGLDDSIEVVALIDADTVPHVMWLKELVAPLSDPGVGATTGVRWFPASAATWGNVVRYLWNVPAIGWLDAFRIAWGGTLAFRREAFAKAGLLDKWSRAFCEDTMTDAALRPAGLRLAFVPTLVTLHRDTCTLAAFREWCVRQMLASRLYHPAWPLIVAHAAASALGWLLPILAAVIAAFAGDGAAIGWSIGALAIYWSALAIGLLMLELSFRRPLLRRGEHAGPLTLLTLLKLILAIPLTQAVYSLILIRTLRVRRVTWRGVSYEIGGPWDVQHA